MKLYNYYRSSAAFRVRIALEIKSLKYEYVAIHLAKGEQLNSALGDILPDQIVPVLLTRKALARFEEMFK